MTDLHQPPPFRRSLPERQEREGADTDPAAVLAALPFPRLNLFRNPFGELTLRERAELAVPLPEVETALRERAPGPFALQFLGHPGRGKTSHLMALRLRYPHAPYIYLPEDGPLPKLPLGPRIPGLQDPQPVLIVDETQRLSPAARRRLFSPPGRLGMLGINGPDLLIVGTHEDHTAEFAAAGRLSVSIHIQRVTPQRLAEIFQRRIDSSRRDPSKPAPYLEAAAIDWFIATYKDDIRGMEHHLYACVQAMAKAGKRAGPVDPTVLPITPWPPPPLSC